MTRLILLFSLALSQPVLAINKCIVNGKTVYQEAECPRGSVQKPIAEHLDSKPTSAVRPKLPELQRGQWKIGTSSSSTCGDPLASFRQEYAQLDDLRQQGCTVGVTTPKNRSITVTVDCPKSVGPSMEGRTSILFSSPTPQSYSIDYVLRDGRRNTSSGTRIGEC